MEQVTLDYARAHLDELLARAQAGESIEITDSRLGTVRLQPVAPPSSERPQRLPGRWKQRLSPPPDSFFAPLSEDELKLWYGENA
jgi:prevent-host-death family protein